MLLTVFVMLLSCGGDSLGFLFLLWSCGILACGGFISGAGLGFGFLGSKTTEGARLKLRGPRIIRLGLIFSGGKVGFGKIKVEADGELFIKSRLLGDTLRLMVGELGSSARTGRLFCLKGDVKFC